MQAILLGALQGLTEFIPVSSSGHLALLPPLFGVPSPPLAFGVAVHAGTLASACAYYWRDIGAALGGLGRLCSGALSGRGRQLLKDDKWARLAVLVLVGTLPTVVIALVFEHPVKKLFQSPVAAAGLLLVTGTVLVVADRLARRRAEGGGDTEADTPLAKAIAVGVAQGIAILPGISRSGSCIATGLATGLERRFSVKFAFLLMIPAVLGAAVLEGKDLVNGALDATTVHAALVGAVVAAFAGLLAIWATIRVVSGGKLWVFGVYCLVLGAVGLVLLLSGVVRGVA